VSFDNWDEIRTAYQVARLGTVSGAAEVLGVHHATVIRHIDALEKRLGTKLFQRHARGYTATEAGRDLQLVAQTTEDQFSQLVGRIKGQGESVTGELVITSIAGLTNLVTPVFVAFQQEHPDLRLLFLADSRLFRLEYGEAHVAIRAGAMPSEPDNVVQPLTRVRWGLFAATAYAERHGLPATPDDLVHHRFIGTSSEASRAPFNRWLAERVAPENFTFLVSDLSAMDVAIKAAAGIGFMPAAEAREDPGLIEVMPSLPEWEVPLWLVTHVDLHRTNKVQTFLRYMKEAAKAWDCL
jgi:DNA-binding transcriptional LysR family regulator